MENKNNKKKKYYYQNNKNHYYKKNNKENSDKRKTYSDIVNLRNDISEIANNNSSSDNSLKVVFLAIVALAIVFGSLLLFHLI